jgi:hypothetical protein
MTDLISGKEALIALANGEEVEYWCENDPSIQKRWTPIKALNEYKLSYFLENKSRFEFRLKPRTITLNGIEVPCCGEDYQYGDAMYILNSLEPTEYSMIVLDKVDEVPLYWWRTEEEIKQVVEALRQIFGRSDDVNAVRGGK